MALKALDIFKHLPKTNCGKCGFPTCLAFSMQIAAKKASLDDCPDVTDEARAAFEGSSAPPMRTVAVGKGDCAVETGGETVLFRHEETFYHASPLAIRIKDDLGEQEIKQRIDAIKALSFERVGQKIAVDMVAVENASGDKDKFLQAVNAACTLDLAMVLMCGDADTMAAAVACSADRKPLLHAANGSNWERMGKVACQAGCPLVVDASDLDQAADLTGKLTGAGVADLVLDVTAGDFAKTMQALTEVRRLALKKNFRALGYPTMAVASGSDDLALGEASSFMAKYANVVVTDAYEPWQVLPLLTVRQNIFTDPRKPVQVEPKLYEVGGVNKQSPLLITTNFSLTYYTVQGDVEASRIPCYIGVIDTEGTSVLTAWASEKLTVDKVVKFLQDDGVRSKLSHNKVIVPGYVAVMSGKLEDESGWEVLVGPRESSGIPKYLKTMWSAS